MTTKATLGSSASCAAWLNAMAAAFGPGRACTAPNSTVPMTAMPIALPTRWAVPRMAPAGPALLPRAPGEYEVLVRGDHHPAAEPGYQQRAGQVPSARIRSGQVNDQR